MKSKLLPYTFTGWQTGRFSSTLLSFLVCHSMLSHAVQTRIPLPVAQIFINTYSTFSSIQGAQDLDAAFFELPNTRSFFSSFQCLSALGIDILPRTFNHTSIPVHRRIFSRGYFSLLFSMRKQWVLFVLLAHRAAYIHLFANYYQYIYLVPVTLLLNYSTNTTLFSFPVYYLGVGGHSRAVHLFYLGKSHLTSTPLFLCACMIITCALV